MYFYVLSVSVREKLIDNQIKSKNIKLETIKKIQTENCSKMKKFQREKLDKKNECSKIKIMLDNAKIKLSKRKELENLKNPK